MALIELTTQEANILLQTLDDSIRNRGMVAAEAYAIIAKKITLAFNLSEKTDAKSEESV